MRSLISGMCGFSDLDDVSSYRKRQERRVFQCRDELRVMGGKGRDGLISIL